MIRYLRRFRWELRFVPLRTRLRILKTLEFVAKKVDGRLQTNFHEPLFAARGCRIAPFRKNGNQHPTSKHY